jgi:hypothetical protein
MRCQSHRSDFGIQRHLMRTKGVAIFGQDVGATGAMVERYDFEQCRQTFDVLEPLRFEGIRYAVLVVIGRRLMPSGWSPQLKARMQRQRRQFRVSQR